MEVIPLSKINILSPQGGKHTSNSGEKISQINKPLVSVVTVVWNAGNLLEHTIESVRQQTYDNIEFIVIDGGSRDGTLDVLRRFDNDIDYWISETDRGIYDAMNKGILACSGELIGIIGAGDWYSPDAIENVVNTYVRTDADVVYGDVELVDCETGVSCKRESKAELMPKTMSSISHPSTFTKACIYRARPFDISFQIAADYDLFLYLYLNGYLFAHSNALITHILSGGVSASYATIVEVYIVHRKNYGIIKALKIFVFSAIRHSVFEMRRSILKTLLPPKYFSVVRSYWLRSRSK